MNAKRFIFLAAICLLAQFAQSQHLNPVSPSGNNAWSFSSTDLYLSQRVGSDPPFYWGFWIFGDGEYSPSGMRLHPPDYWTTYNSLIPSQFNQPVPGQYTQQLRATHDYPLVLGAHYTPLCYAIPRKTGPPPPVATYVALETPSTITVSSLGGGTYTRQPLLPSLTPPGRRIYVEHSHGYYNHLEEQSVFAISYNPPLNTCNDDMSAVLLFFNSEEDASTKQISAAQPSMFRPNLPRDIHVPNYSQPITPLRQWVTAHDFDAVNFSTPYPTHFEEDFVDVFKLEFSNSYINAVRNSAGGVGANGEFRIFPVVKTVAAPSPSSNNKSYALAVLASTCKPQPYDATTAQRLSGILDSVAPNSSSANPIGIGNLWVIDVDTVFLKSGEPIDPNQLVIEDVCTCKQNKSYRVRFKLTYCNVGTGPANSAIIHLNPLHPTLSFCEMIGVKDESGNPLSYSWASPNTLTINSVLAGGGCAEVSYTMTATLPGTGLPTGQTGLDYLKSLLGINPVAGGDVTFSGSGPLAFANKTLGDDPASDQIRKNMGNNCSDCCCGSICISWPWKILIAVVSLAISLWLLPKILSKRSE